MTYDDLKTALVIFGLDDTQATAKEIKKKHRELVKKYHPNANDGQDSDYIKKVNAAYKIIGDYCGSYKFSFSEEEFYKQNPEEHLRKRFMDDPLWGR
ncbi:MAG: J domain-containing protein [Nitrospirota bacterium]